MHGRFGCGARRRQLLRTFGDNTVAIQQFNLKRHIVFRRFQILHEAIDFEGRSGRQDILRSYEDVLNKRRGHDSQGDLTVDAPEGEVVNLVTERRNIGPFAGININRQHILSVEVEMRRQLKGEWRVSALILSQPCSVDPDGRGGHYAFKVNENVLSARFRRKLEATAIKGHELVSLLIETMPWQGGIRMRDHDLLKSGVVEFF